MTTVAPPALTQLAADLKARKDRPADYVMDGIVGNTEHLAKAKSDGTYHISAEDCGSQYGHLYSLNDADDIAGGKAHPTYASAWDLHWGPADMILVTNRLIASAKDPLDHRLDSVAEIAGTTNGHSVHAYYNDSKTDDPNNTGGWDSGHVTHNHLSIKRNKCYDYDSLVPILDVICGVPLEVDMTTDELIAALKSEAGQAAIRSAVASTQIPAYDIDGHPIMDPTTKKQRTNPLARILNNTNTIGGFLQSRVK